MASLRELNQRRVDRMGGKGLYEEANEGVVNTLRDAIGTPVSPRKSEGGVAPTPAAEVSGAIQNTPVSQQAPQAPTLGPNAVNLPKNPYDTGFDITPRQGLRREAFGPAIANQGATSMDRLAGQGYARRDVQGAPGVSRLTGADGRTIYTNNLEDTADWVQGGMRGGTVNTLSGPSVQEMTDRADRMRTLREGNTALRDGLGFNQGNALSRTPDRQEVIDQLLSGKSRSGRQVAAALIEGERRAEGEAAKLAEATRQAGLRNAIDEKRLGIDERRLGIDEKRFEFDKQPKPLSEIDKLRLAEAQYGLMNARAAAANAALDRAGVSQEDRNSVFINFDGEGGITDQAPHRMDGAAIRGLRAVQANKLANQYSIGGATSEGVFTPVEKDEFRLKDWWNGGENAPGFLETLGSTKGDVVVGADGRRPNMKALRKSLRDIDLLKNFEVRN